MNNLLIRELQKTDVIPYDLLLQADPSKEIIDRYLLHSTIYIATLNDQTIGCYVICEVAQKIVEIKNISIDETQQRKGYGTMLLNDAIQRSRSKGFQKIIIATGNSSLHQLHLYQKLGFRITEIKADYFTNNYPGPIIENGIICRDMIILTLIL